MAETVKCPRCGADVATIDGDELTGPVLSMFGLIPEFIVCPKCNAACTLDEEGKLEAVATVL